MKMRLMKAKMRLMIKMVASQPPVDFPARTPLFSYLLQLRKRSPYYLLFTAVNYVKNWLKQSGQFFKKIQNSLTKQSHDFWGKEKHFCFDSFFLLFSKNFVDVLFRWKRSKMTNWANKLFEKIPTVPSCLRKSFSYASSAEQSGNFTASGQA